MKELKVIMEYIKKEFVSLISNCLIMNVGILIKKGIIVVNDNKVKVVRGVRKDGSSLFGFVGIDVDREIGYEVKYGCLSEELFWENWGNSFSDSSNVVFEEYEIDIKDIVDINECEVVWKV